MMKKNTRSLLEELENISANRDIQFIVESRANNIINSAIHLLEVIDRNYSKEQSAILEKKLLIAIKNRDTEKFSKSLKRSKDQKVNNENQ